MLWRNVASRGWIQPAGTGQQLTASWSAGSVPGAYWSWNTLGTPPRCRPGRG
ncbi:MAG TPA: hypothetical protein VG268_09015 [Streptosporangiaceae bacterium]|nr:hypothetical protein [Streptosporangiaceae bacterium]